MVSGCGKVNFLKALKDLCGLSIEESAEFLAVRPDSVKAWLSGRKEAPDGVIESMIELAEAIRDFALKLANRIESVAFEGDEIIVGIPTPEEILKLGLPTRSTLERALVMASVESGFRIEIADHDLIDGAMMVKIKP